MPESGTQYVNGAPSPAVIDVLGVAAVDNNYRHVLKTMGALQVTLQTIPPGRGVLELRPQADTTVFVLAGTAQATIGADVWLVNPGQLICVPAMNRLEILNAQPSAPLKVMTTYSAPQYATGKVDFVPIRDDPIPPSPSQSSTAVPSTESPGLLARLGIGNPASPSPISRTTPPPVPAYSATSAQPQAQPFLGAAASTGSVPASPSASLSRSAGMGQRSGPLPFINL